MKVLQLVNFMGSDTLPGINLANRYYFCDMAGFSIPAAEHSTITSWGKDREVDAYRNMISQFGKPGSLVAVVSDSYDLENAVKNLWCGSLKKDVINSGATVVVRPDSGDPVEIVLSVVKMLDEGYGSAYNSKGYKVLNHVRVIQGDGVNEESIAKILKSITDVGYSATNVAFGMGGALLQKLDRDTQRFAYKCSSVTIDGKDVPVFKMPKTDPSKASKSGKLDLIRRNGKFETVPGPAIGSELVTYYDNGKPMRQYTLTGIRNRVNSFLPGAE